MADIRNFTAELGRAEAFLRAKCALISTSGLSIHIKYTRARRRDVTGYYRFADRRIVIAVKRRLRYPRKAAYGVGSVRLVRTPARGRPYKLVWHEERFDCADDLLAFVAGHEIWHFLCHSGQRKGDHETKANCNGFLWLREFQGWQGQDAAVEPIPALPPRPDVIATAAPPAASERAAGAPIADPARERRDPAVPVQPVSTDMALAALPTALLAARAWVQRELFSDVFGVEAPAPPQPPSRARRGRRRGTR